MRVDLMELRDNFRPKVCAFSGGEVSPLVASLGI